ncbi:SET domain-containing protein 4 isoform X2 [Lethenteron reissneri]|uniref:SET domain-containing protein 4 isoform X2 n=1 Tax=Lethenteron reissneri TaxID=7753 RepID=UPI002AB63FC9|nr:SET domain-containing protein 4 isoform X2 [Lethenteron reissneri]
MPSHSQFRAGHLPWALPTCSGSVTALQALCVFLICERFFSQSKTCLPLARDGDPALQQHKQPGQWGPYIAVLPASYSCPAYFSSEERSALPAPLRQEAEAQVAALLQDWRGTRPLVRLLQPLFPEPVSRVFCKDAFRWAWCSVNTRAVYLPAQPCPALAGGTGSLALAPVLDLLNHHPSAKVAAGFNEATREYEVRAGQTHARHSQVFICYGPHDSQGLLLHYGFVCDANPHDVVYATVDDVLGVACGPSTAAEWKLTLLQKRDLTRNLTFGVDGPSWRLLTAIGILCLPAHKTHLVSDVIVGRGSMQEEMQELALKLCCCMEQARRMTIARMSPGSGEPSRLLLQLLTQELCILVSARSAMQRQRQTAQVTATTETTTDTTATTDTTKDTTVTTETTVTTDTTAQATATTETTTTTDISAQVTATTDTTATTATTATTETTATTDTTVTTNITAQSTAITDTSATTATTVTTDTTEKPTTDTTATYATAQAAARTDTSVKVKATTDAVEPMTEVKD